MPSVILPRGIDKRLMTFAESARQIAILRGVASNNPVVLRMTTPISGNISIVVCSLEEPVNAILPVNVLWIDLNPSSMRYLKVYRRLGKTGGSNGLVHRWEMLSSYLHLNDAQTYDSEDLSKIQASISFGPASYANMGIVRLSTPAATASDPIAISDTDPRLSDARNPLPHTHALPPVTAIKTATGVVNISQAIPPAAGKVLIATSATTAEWRQLVHTDIVQEINVIPVSLVTAFPGPSTLQEGRTVTLASEVTFSDGTVRNITSTTGMTFTSSNTNIASFAANVLTAHAVSADARVLLTATYNENGVTVTDSAHIIVSNSVTGADQTVYPVSIAPALFGRSAQISASTARDITVVGNTDNLFDVVVTYNDNTTKTVISAQWFVTIPGVISFDPQANIAHINAISTDTQVGLIVYYHENGKTVTATDTILFKA